MKRFEEPIAELQKFEVVDVLTVSGGNGPGENVGEDDEF